MVAALASSRRRDVLMSLAQLAPSTMRSSPVTVLHWFRRRWASSAWVPSTTMMAEAAGIWSGSNRRDQPGVPLVVVDECLRHTD